VASVEGAMSKNPHNCAQWQRCSSLSSTLHEFFPTFGNSGLRWYGQARTTLGRSR
jgi:hypothetical protein